MQIIVLNGKVLVSAVLKHLITVLFSTCTCLGQAPNFWKEKMPAPPWYLLSQFQSTSSIASEVQGPEEQLSSSFHREK